MGLPISVALGSSDDEDFKTTRPVGFHDFDGKMMEVGEVSVVLYSWSAIKIYNGRIMFSGFLAKLRINGGSISTPGAAAKAGIISLHDTDGRISDPGGVPLDIPEPDLPKEEPLIPHKISGQVAYRIPADALFEFDSAAIAFKADVALSRAGDHLKAQTKNYEHIYMTGHTGSIGGKRYNLRLSKRRAEAVAKWLVDNGDAEKKKIVAIGMGESRPLLPDKRPTEKIIPATANRTGAWKFC